MQASKEQLAIIAALSHSNVAVNAVAGSGKTATIKFIAQEYKDKAILVLTYNKSLQIDTEARLADNANASVYTIHSFAYNFYDSKSSYGDTSIYAAMEKQLVVPVSYDIIIIDECQDLTQLYFDFIIKVIADTARPSWPDRISDVDKASITPLATTADHTSGGNCNNDGNNGSINSNNNNSSNNNSNNNSRSSNYTICLLGDIRQCIYKYKGSNTKYLEQPSIYFPDNGTNWQYLQLSQSYRIDANMANFINNCMYNGNVVISSSKQAEKKISYIHLKKDNGNELLFSAIYDIIEQYNYDDIMVLAPSLGKDVILQDISNKLSKCNVPLYYSKENTDGNKKALMANKLAMSTIHAAKGMERKVVILYRFDESYYYFQRQASKNACDNLLYVALTRASEKLVIIHNSQYKYLPYFDSIAASNYCDVISSVMPNAKSVIIKEQTHFSVTSLIDHLPFELESKLIGMLKIEKYDVASPYKINNCINNKLGSSDIVEDVYSINGMLIPLYNSYLFDKDGFRAQILNFIDAAKHKFGPIPNRYLEYRERALLRDPKLNEYNILAAYYNTTTTYTHKIILEFLSKEQLENLNYAQISAYDMSRLATAIYCINENLIYKHNQLKNKYGWLNDCDIEKLSGRIESQLTGSRCYEYAAKKNIEACVISGRLDCISTEDTTNIIWEYKCVSQLTNSHILQLALYAFLLEGTAPIHPQASCNKYKLFNLLSGQIIEISADTCTYENIACALINNKLNRPQSNFFSNINKYALPNVTLRNGTKHVTDVDNILVKLYFINHYDHAVLTEALTQYQTSLSNLVSQKKYTLANLVRIAKAIYTIDSGQNKKIKYTPPPAEQIRDHLSRVGATI
jgi:superfamily I DNA/RNA helicase